MEKFQSSGEVPGEKFWKESSGESSGVPGTSSGQVPEVPGTKFRSSGDTILNY
jgi:hypothetical protein